MKLRSSINIKSFLNIEPLKRQIGYKKDLIQLLKKNKQTNKHTSYLRFHLYYELVLRVFWWLSKGCCGRGWALTFGVFLWRYWKSSQHDLHVLGGLFFL